MALRTQGCTLGYRIWPPWGFHLALSGPEQKRTATEQNRTERRSKTGFL